jgi:hypothetical protein
MKPKIERRRGFQWQEQSVLVGVVKRQQLVEEALRVVFDAAC